MRSAEIPQYEEVFKGVKVPLPTLTLLVVQSYPYAAAVLVSGAVGCGIATRVWGHRRRTILLNAAYLLLTLLCLTALTTALHLLMMSAFHNLDNGIRAR
jgi:hypothetical protein